jgi:hypothetical protein
VALYSISTDKFSPVPATTFMAESILERKHLQRMLRADTTPLGEELLVLSEEYGNWEDSNRRIDLLCLDKQGGLVVVEIKRTEDGGHMELQAIRYAAMVSSMTLDQAVAAHAKMLGGDGADLAARKSVAEFWNACTTKSKFRERHLPTTWPPTAGCTPEGDAKGYDTPGHLFPADVLATCWRGCRPPSPQAGKR